MAQFKTTHLNNLEEISKVYNIKKKSMIGKLVKFRYSGEDTFDKRPVVRIVSGTSEEIKGFNLNLI